MTVSILAGFLGILAMGLLWSLLRLRSLSSKPDSPTPTSTLSTPSEETIIKVMTMTVETAKEMAAENRKLTEALILGREAPSESSNGQPPSWQMPQTVYDAESTPLSPGIEAVMMRESEEDQLAVSLRERAALQERMRELQEEENRQAQRTSEDSSQEPWFPQVL